MTGLVETVPILVVVIEVVEVVGTVPFSNTFWISLFFYFSIGRIQLFLGSILF